MIRPSMLTGIPIRTVPAFYFPDGISFILMPDLGPKFAMYASLFSEPDPGVLTAGPARLVLITKYTRREIELMGADELMFALDSEGKILGAEKKD